MTIEQVIGVLQNGIKESDRCNEDYVRLSVPVAEEMCRCLENESTSFSSIVDHAGQMTERCYRAEAERDHLREIAQERWEERNAARDLARGFRWLALLPDSSPDKEEDIDELTQRCGEWITCK